MKTGREKKWKESSIAPPLAVGRGCSAGSHPACLVKPPALISSLLSHPCVGTGLQLLSQSRVSPTLPVVIPTPRPPQDSYVVATRRADPPHLGGWMSPPCTAHTEDGALPATPPGGVRGPTPAPSLNPILINQNGTAHLSWDRNSPATQINFKSPSLLKMTSCWPER